MSGDFELQLVRRFQRLALRFDATMCVASGKGEGSGPVLRKRAEAPLLVQDGAGIIQTCRGRRRGLCLRVSQDSLVRKRFVEYRHLINQSIEGAMVCVRRNNADPVADGEIDFRIIWRMRPL